MCKNDKKIQELAGAISSLQANFIAYASAFEQFQKQFKNVDTLSTLNNDAINDFGDRIDVLEQVFCGEFVGYYTREYDRHHADILSDYMLARFQENEKARLSLSSLKLSKEPISDDDSYPSCEGCSG